MPSQTAAAFPALKPWRFVVAFGLVSLFADMVYEGARSIIGPYLATLGASATVVGIAAGAGEFIGYGLRVVSGYLVQHSRRYWTWTIVGYALTVLSVPLIGYTTALVPALLLYGSERLGKAVRSPAKDTLLSHASTQTGRGTAFGVHQAMDQFGAVAGPLLLAGVLSLREGDYRVAFTVLAVPGAIVLALLFWLRARVPDPAAYEQVPPPSAVATPPAPVTDSLLRGGLPPLLWQYIGAIGVLSCGVASFPLIAFHAVHNRLLTEPQIPLLFALAMLVDGVSGLVFGRLYDVRGARLLLLVPVAAGAAAVAFTDRPWLVWVGVGVWGLVSGILDSTVKAVVTELVPSASRAAGFGWLSLVRGLGLLAAGGLLGIAYDQSRGLVVGLVIGINVAALLALYAVLARVTQVAVPRRSMNLR